MAGRYSEYNIFLDWITCTAISIQNACIMIHDDVWKKREEQYLATICKYSKEEQKKLSLLLSELVDTYENEEMSDILGEIFMESGCGSKQTGQFFTPFHLSELTARTGIDCKNISQHNKLGFDDFIGLEDVKITQLNKEKSND